MNKPNWFKKVRAKHWFLFFDTFFKIEIVQDLFISKVPPIALLRTALDRTAVSKRNGYIYSIHYGNQLSQWTSFYH